MRPWIRSKGGASGSPATRACTSTGPNGFESTRTVRAAASKNGWGRRGFSGRSSKRPRRNGVTRASYRGSLLHVRLVEELLGDHPAVDEDEALGRVAALHDQLAAALAVGLLVASLREGAAVLGHDGAAVGAADQERLAV